MRDVIYVVVIAVLTAGVLGCTPTYRTAGGAAVGGAAGVVGGAFLAGPIGAVAGGAAGAATGAALLAPNEEQLR
jgi:osmotically inducible lipoprotein OsmB